MYAYADSSASATQLTPFVDPPQTTNSAAATKTMKRMLEPYFRTQIARMTD